MKKHFIETKEEVTRMILSAANGENTGNFGIYTKDFCHTHINAMRNFGRINRKEFVHLHDYVEELAGKMNVEWHKERPEHEYKSWGKLVEKWRKKCGA